MSSSLYTRWHLEFGVGALWFSGETCIPINSLCGEPWHVDSWNSWRVTSSYFHCKQPLLMLLLPLLCLQTVASFQGHRLRALLIIWQVFSKINYSRLGGCNYEGWRDCINFCQHHFQTTFPLITMSMDQTGCRMVFVILGLPSGKMAKQIISGSLSGRSWRPKK